MNCDDARKYFVDVWRGARDVPAEMDEHLAGCAACRQEVEDLGMIWNRLEALPDAEPSPRLRQEFYTRLSNYREGGGRWSFARWSSQWLRSPAFQAVAAVAILAAGIGAGRFTGRGNDATVARLQDEVSDMKQMVALSLLREQSAGDRLKGVDWVTQTPGADQKVLDALIATANHDTNVNVRVAAIEALGRFNAMPSVRTALPKSLSRQDSPLAQIAVLDEIVELRERSAAPVIRTLMTQTDVNPAVKQHAQWALRQLE
jgi:anti-sigma-K factor RskA